MSVTTLTTEAMEEGFYAIDIAFTDEDGDAVVPNADTIVWTLTDQAGNVINSRDAEEVESAASITIELDGADLAIQSGESAPIVRRRLIVKWEYDSDLGNDKVGYIEVIFPIRNLTRLPVEIPA